jgi:23S rRNA (guanine2445-N2)-methyltransferase / 23S rRNA (guanine2069-N7)-methyltransferase
MNLKHTHPFFATCPKSLELLLEEELQSLGASQTRQTVSGVTFQGSLEMAYKACLWSRLANRILLPLTSFPAGTAEELYQGASKVRWHEHMDEATTFVVNFTGMSDDLQHTQFAAQKVKDAIVDQFRRKSGARPSVDKQSPMVRINAVLRKGQVTLSLDLSGDSLHRRGYRLDGGEAPLKENLAAAILIRAKWPEIAKQGGCLVDPMCGSGTLLIEGLLMAADIAPGLNRQRFGFQGWKLHQPKLWEKLRQEAEARAKQGKLTLLNTVYGFDVNPKAIEDAKSNVSRAGFSKFINLSVLDLKQLSSHNINKTFGLCIVNPPYGERLEEAETLMPLYKILTLKLKENFLNWEAAILTGNTELTRTMGLRAYKKYAFYNGTIPCQLLLFHIKPEWFINQTN